MSTESRRPTSGRSRLLSDEDVALWSHVTRGIDPVSVKRRVHAKAQPPPEIPPPHAPDEPARQPPPRVAATHIPRPTPVKPAPAAAKTATPGALARRQVRKLAGGHTDIDARVDLHGLYQDEAYGVLRRFLLRCYASGHRNVLVITGKGGAPVRDDSEPWGQRERGVLRRNVPRWLAEPELSAIVVSYTTAHARHGGEGAIYVVLRNARRHRGD